MQSDTLFRSLTRSLALSSEAVYSDRAQVFLPVLEGHTRRPTVAPAAYGNEKGLTASYVTIDQDGGRIAHDDGRIRAMSRETAREDYQAATMAKTFAAAPLAESYLVNVVYQPLSLVGLAVRVQQAFGLGHLYTKSADGDLIFLADPSIPSRLVRYALQTVALDRVVVEAIYNESVLAAARHGEGGPVCRELNGTPQGPAGQIRAAYLAILRGVLETPAYRDLVGNELPELF